MSEISRQVHESSVIAGEAVRQAEKTDARINALSEAATRIGNVVKLITDIAEQTNLLALNATIEAARAGEAGRGFAVVASEVKTLATQTAKATEDISEQIAEMQAATREFVQRDQGNQLDHRPHLRHRKLDRGGGRAAGRDHLADRNAASTARRAAPSTRRPTSATSTAAAADTGAAAARCSLRRICSQARAASSSSRSRNSWRPSAPPKASSSATTRRLRRFIIVAGDALRQEQRQSGRIAMRPWLALGVLALLCQPAASQDLSGRTVSMLIGFGPGGGYDLWGRTVGAAHRQAPAGQAERRAAEHAGGGKLRRREPHLRRRAERRHGDRHHRARRGARPAHRRAGRALRRDQVVVARQPDQGAQRLHRQQSAPR